MSCSRKERRKYNRYDTEAKVYFHVKYNLKTKLKFKVLDKNKDWFGKEKYPGLARDISVEGLRFSSDKKVKNGCMLYLEVYLPRQKKPINMTGEARWSKEIPGRAGKRYKFDTGVLLEEVDGMSVGKSVYYYDKKHGVCWSIALESIFGNFRRLMQKQKKLVARK